MFQKELFYLKDQPKDLKKLLMLFSLIPSQQEPYVTGRPPHPKSAMLHACIIKNLKSFYCFSDLTRYLWNFPETAHTCGFSNIPSLERFSSFIKDTPNSFFTTIKEHLIIQLIESEVIPGKYISVDSCPIKANVKENNLKTNVRDRFNKYNIPDADPDCRLGSYTIFPSNKKQQFFWGYRNFVLIDALSELPVAEITKPANVHESNMILPQLNYVKDTFNLKIKAVIGDSAFDSTAIINSVVKDFKAKPIFAYNPRNSKKTSEVIKSINNGIPHCIANFPMADRGIFYDNVQNRTRHKFICPIKAFKKFAKNHPFCPWNHPNFFNKKQGCSTYLRVDNNDVIRKSINRSSKSFKKLYNLRTGSERIFSRILYLTLKDPKLKGINSFANLLSIAHITHLAIALLAVNLGFKDHIRFVKKFFPDFSL